MKHLFYIFFILTFLLGCGEKKNYVVQQFQNNTKISNLNGIPLDSTYHYFPDSLFLDSVSHSIDSFEFQMRQVSRSYLLYKMKEPILSNYFLKKEIYRITAIRSFHRPFCIRVENDNDSLILSIKILDRNVGIPEIVFSKSDSIIYPKDPTLVFENEFKIPISKWDSLETLIHSSDFWTSKPRFDLNYLQIDGSTWIIEGQNKFGYQVKVIPSPFFNKKKNPYRTNKFDSKDRYVEIFEYLIRLAKLTEEKLY